MAQQDYASSILNYALKHNLHFKGYSENLTEGPRVRIRLTNCSGVPDISLIAELFLFNGKAYYNPDINEEGKGLVKYLNQKFPGKVKKLSSRYF